MSSSSIAIRIKWGERVKVGFFCQSENLSEFLQILNKTAEYELKWVRQCGDSTTLKKGLTPVPRILTDEIPQICKSVLSSRYWFRTCHSSTADIIPHAMTHWWSQSHCRKNVWISRHGLNLFPENLKISPSAVSPAGWNPPLWRLNPPGFLPKLSSWLKTNPWKPTWSYFKFKARFNFQLWLKYCRQITIITYTCICIGVKTKLDHKNNPNTSTTMLWSDNAYLAVHWIFQGDERQLI